ncbi:MAG TPA: [FeFe] hydrogenase, group A [Candidatus Brocadiia bacterium]|nr:[FeFe] hydrogenase, group A [Candidatus Brocadiia bacterium]
MSPVEYVTIDGKDTPIEGERNLLEMIRKMHIDIPTFCYHSELSVYGACRLCLVEVEGMGTVASCSTAPKAGMKVRTSTEDIRAMRRVTLELLLANGDHYCPTCPKNGSCRLQELARRMGIREVRFKRAQAAEPKDTSSAALVRDPDKCVLCGDCVRACAEIQGIGAIDFAHRGAKAAVLPAFGKALGDVECVNCGQCARVCPTGALTPKSEVEAVWKAIADPKKTVVVQIAPAVRVALGEAFDMPPGAVVTGKMVAALRALGFDQVYDTPFAADLTVIEEATEFLGRKTQGGTLPMFTSCCPAWVRYMEQYYPDLLGNLSSCRSPQQMFGSLAKATLPAKLGVDRKDLVVVSIMPCTAKKAEAKEPKFAVDGSPDVDHVLTTQELARMIDESGLDFAKLESAAFDMPFGFKTGAGVIFGASGGVTEAVLRYAAGLKGLGLGPVDWQAVRGGEGSREAVVKFGGGELKIAVACSLKNAKAICEAARAGKSPYDFVEIMACPGGCVGGAGQPVNLRGDTRRLRARGLYEDDCSLQLRNSADNFVIKEVYDETLGEVGGEKAHHLLHTEYQTRRRMAGEEMSLTPAGAEKLPVSVCVGTSCYLRGSQSLLTALARKVAAEGLAGRVQVKATFCFEKCDKGPNVRVGGVSIDQCTLDKAMSAIRKALGAPVA